MEEVKKQNGEKECGWRGGGYMTLFSELHEKCTCIYNYIQDQKS